MQMRIKSLEVHRQNLGEPIFASEVLGIEDFHAESGEYRKHLGMNTEQFEVSAHKREQHIGYLSNIHEPHETGVSKHRDKQHFQLYLSPFLP